MKGRIRCSRTSTVFLILATFPSLSGCLSEEESDPEAAAFQGPTDGAPIISGAPPESIEVSAAYLFTPNASDPDGDVLTFRIEGLPLWAEFSAYELPRIDPVASTGTRVIR
jgi:hypothetical protein